MTTIAISTTADPDPTQSSGKALWTGRVVSTVAVLFLTMDTVMKLLLVPVAVAGTKQLGYPVSAIFPLGVVSLVCLIIYLIPRTSIFGAILWTGYLGGAVATHVRVGDPLFSHILFPIYVALMLWGGLWFRDGRLRALIPVRR